MCRIAAPVGVGARNRVGLGGVWCKGYPVLNVVVPGVRRSPRTVERNRCSCAYGLTGSRTHRWNRIHRNGLRLRGSSPIHGNGAGVGSSLRGRNRNARCRGSSRTPRIRGLAGSVQLGDFLLR